MSIGIWTNQGTVKSTISTRHLECCTILYDINPVILSANLDGKIFKIWGSTINGPCYAESADGITWTDYASNPLLPSIVAVHETKIHKQGTTYYMYDGPIPGGPIAAYTSTDGVTWVLQNVSTIAQGSAGSVDAFWAGQLAVVDVVGGTWYGYYAGQAVSNGPYVMIQATSTDGINWTKNYSNQITTFGPSNFDFHKINGTYYGWSQCVMPGIPNDGALGLPSDIFRFSSTSPSGPWTVLSNYPTFYRTLATEGIGTILGQVADPCLVEGPSGNLYIFFTQKSAGQLGNNGVVGCAISPSTIFTQLVQTYEGLVNIPIPWGSSGTPLQLTSLALDNFQRANANPIGGNWSPFHSGSGFTTAQLLSNVGTSSSIGINCDSFWNPITWAADQWSQIKVSACAATSFVGLNLRDNTSGVLTAYRLYWTGSTGSSGTFQPQRVVSGAFVNLAPASGLAGVVNIGDILTASIVGTTYSMYQNGNLIITNTDSNVTSGAAGWFVSPTTAIANASVANWSAGSISNPSPPVISIFSATGSLISQINSLNVLVRQV